MAKRNPQRSTIPPSPTAPNRPETRGHDAVGKSAGKTTESSKAWREAIESIVIAIVLAFLFRAFEAEAFVIPTGSMAPTLQGRHKDVECPECGYQYQAGASLDAETDQGSVVAAKCPMCFYTLAVDPRSGAHKSFTGDRILVNKFAYEQPFGEPKRWDVIVFKYPGNAKQNYIKRMVGVDEETLRIRHGDIFTHAAPNAAPDANFTIERKPPAKLKHMLQLVHDTDHISESMRQLDWPTNWQAARPGTWEVSELGNTFRCPANANGSSNTAQETAWLNFRQFYVDFNTWERLANREELETPRVVPITDFYAYNAQSRPNYGSVHHPKSIGDHWVGDLGLEADLVVESDTGMLWLDLVEAGRHHYCQIDVATGQATFSISDPQVLFEDANGTPMNDPVATTELRGQGRYRLRFTNCDNELLLWVNESLCKFDQPTTYAPTPNDRPVASDSEPGDLQPARIGSEGAQLAVHRLRVLRDIYYIATSSGMSDYRATPEMVFQHLVRPDRWRRGDLFDERGSVMFSMEAEQYFALGDNSPASKDGRLWGREHYVEREMLIGKAVLIYWPHPWWGVLPNVKDMGLIH